MLVFDEKERKKALPEGIWRDYKPGVRVKVRPGGKLKAREFVDAATVDGVLDKNLIDHLTFNYAIEEWEGFVDPDRKPLPCTDTMKEAVTDNLFDFRAWLASEYLKVSNNYEHLREEQLKNSKGSPDGAQPLPDTDSNPAEDAG